MLIDAESLSSGEAKYFKIIHRRNVLCSNLLLAELVKHHKDQLGIEARVVELEPIAAPDPLVGPTREAVVVPMPGADYKSETKVPLPLIIETVGKFYGYGRAELLANRRDKDTVKARHVVMYLASIMTETSFSVIGRCIGGRDHTTVMHGVRKIKKAVKEGKRIADEIAVIKLHISEALLNGMAA